MAFFMFLKLFILKLCAFRVQETGITSFPYEILKSEDKISNFCIFKVGF